MTSRRAKIVNKRTCQGRVDVQSCLEKDDLRRRVIRSDESSCKDRQQEDALRTC